MNGWCEKKTYRQLTLAKFPTYAAVTRPFSSLSDESKSGTKGYGQSDGGICCRKKRDISWIIVGSWMCRPGMFRPCSFAVPHVYAVLGRLGTSSSPWVRGMGCAQGDHDHLPPRRPVLVAVRAWNTRAWVRGPSVLT